MAIELKSPAKVLLFFVGLGLLGYAAFKYGWIPKGKAGGAGAGSSENAAPRSGQVAIDLLYGSEKEKWLKDAVEAFAKKRPDVLVRLKPMGTIDAVRAIAEEREKPTVWSPADEVGPNLLDTEWSLQKGSGIVERSGDLAPQPLVVTPLVLIAWADRAKVLAKAGEVADWRLLHKAAIDPKGWSALGAPAEWGYVKLGHTAPSSSNSGLQAVILMAYAYHQKSSGLKAEDVMDAGFQKWLKELETAVGKFGASSGTYMKDMVLFGPSKYDAIWNYENVAIGDMAAAQGRWGNLRVYYPRPTLWSNHPFVFFKAPWVTEEQKKAARELRDFLLTPEVQQRALEFGFRPANPDVKVLTNDPSNPFSRLSGAGIKVDIPPAAEAPSGEVARLLLETWRRVVGGEAR